MLFGINELDHSKKDDGELTKQPVVVGEGTGSRCSIDLSYLQAPPHKDKMKIFKRDRVNE